MDKNKAEILEKIIQEQVKASEEALTNPAFAHLIKSRTMSDPSYQRKTRDNIQELEEFLNKLLSLSHEQRKAVADAVVYAAIQVRLLEQGMRESGYYIDALKDYLQATLVEMRQFDCSFPDSYQAID